MDNQVLPETNRRKKETGVIGHITETLIGKQSRKVAFGVWGFIAANTLISTGKIDIVTYWKMFLTCALLIGCGTIIDETLAKLGDKIAGFAATKINTVVETTTKVTTDQP